MSGLIVTGRLRRESGLRPGGGMEGGLGLQLGPRGDEAARGRLRYGKSVRLRGDFDMDRSTGSGTGEALLGRGSPFVAKKVFDLSQLLLLLELCLL